MKDKTAKELIEAVNDLKQTVEKMQVTIDKFEQRCQMAEQKEAIEERRRQFFASFDQAALCNQLEHLSKCKL